MSKLCSSAALERARTTCNALGSSASELTFRRVSDLDMNARISSENSVPLNYEVDALRFSSLSESRDGTVMLTKPKIGSFPRMSTCQPREDPEPWMFSPGIGTVIVLDDKLCVVTSEYRCASNLIHVTAAPLTDVVRLEFRGRPCLNVEITRWQRSASTRVVQNLVCTPVRALPKPARVVVLGPTPAAMSFDASGQADRAAANREKFNNTRGYQRVMACHKVLEHDMQTVLQALASSYNANMAQSVEGFREEARLSRTYVWVQGWLSAYKTLSKTVDFSTHDSPHEWNRVVEADSFLSCSLLIDSL